MRHRFQSLGIRFSFKICFSWPVLKGYAGIIKHSVHLQLAADVLKLAISVLLVLIDEASSV